jgi:hypothetical protein
MAKTEEGPSLPAICWFISAAGNLLSEGFMGPLGPFFNFGEPFEVLLETPVRYNAVLKTFKIGFESRGRFGGKAVNDPGSHPSGLHHLMLPKVGKVLGDLRLGKVKDALEMADAKRALSQKVDDAEPGRIAEALVNLDEIHERYILFNPNIRQDEFMAVPASMSPSGPPGTLHFRRQLIQYPFSPLEIGLFSSSARCSDVTALRGQAAQEAHP